MQSLNINNLNTQKIVADEPLFWERQIYMEATQSQRVFDWIFGVVIPVIFWLTDSFIFGNSNSGGAILGTIKPFAYILAFTSILAMSTFLIWGKSLGWLNGVLAGLFFIGGFICFAIGVLIFPISLLGLIFVVGIFGFTPLFGGFTFLRNSVRAYEFARPRNDKKILMLVAILTVLVAITVPVFINIRIEKAKNEMIEGNPQRIRKNVDYLYWVSPITNFDSLKNKIRTMNINNEKRKALNDAYKKLTGIDDLTIYELVN